MSYNLLKGKRGIIFGALNDQSIAWKVAERAVKQDNEYQIEEIFNIPVKRIFKILPAVREHRRRTGNNAYKQNDRYAVADTVGINSFRPST